MRDERNDGHGDHDGGTHGQDAAPAPVDTPLPPDGPVTLAVHSVPMPDLDPPKRSRWTLWLVLLVCAAPVVASYFSFYVLDLRGRAYGDLIQPTRDLPPSLALTDLKGAPVAAASLHGQWLLTYVPDRACDEGCERSGHHGVAGHDEPVDTVGDELADARARSANHRQSRRARLQGRDAEGL